MGLPALSPLLIVSLTDEEGDEDELELELELLGRPEGGPFSLVLPCVQVQ